MRPAFCLGGAGAACVYNSEELEAALQLAIDTSPIKEVLVEESVLGWKEIEFEAMRDCEDNIVIVCSMESQTHPPQSSDSAPLNQHLNRSA